MYAWEMRAVRRVRITPEGVSFGYRLHRVWVTWYDLGPSDAPPDHDVWVIRQRRRPRGAIFRYVPVNLAQAVVTYRFHDAWDLSDPASEGLKVHRQGDRWSAK